MKDIKLTLPSGDVRVVGKTQPIFIAAEIGVTCNYEMDRAKALVDLAAEAGADAVKLAFHFAEDLLSDKSVTYKYPTVKGEAEENMFDMFNYLTFSFEEWTELKSYCDSKNILMFCSVAGGTNGIEWAEKLNLPMHKVGAWDLLDLNQFKRLSQSNIPLVIDVGTVHESEMVQFMEILKDTPTILLHEYHSHNFEEMNIKSLPYIEEKFNTLVGFSSPDSYDVNDFMSIALGAVALEKRVTLSRDTEGHHHILGKEPQEFIQWVKEVRQAESALGELKIQPTKKDLDERKKWFKRVVASKEIKQGEIITAEHIACKRPNTNGIPSEKYDLVIGKTANRNYEYNEPIDEAII